MVDSNNGFNNRGRRHYNNNYRSGYNRRGGYNSNASVGTKGLLNFLFSFNGRISRNLYIGIMLLLAIVYSALNVAGAFVQDESVNIVLSVISIFVFIMDIAVGYKRAHALGISGIYSIFDVVCMPFFCFNRSDRDFANDNVYKPRFKFLKKIGSLVNKNKFTQIAYLFLIFAIVFAPVIFELSGVKGFVILLVSFVLFNILQMLLFRFRWFRRIYTGFVKVVTFIVYNLFIIGVASALTLFWMLSKMS